MKLQEFEKIYKDTYDNTLKYIVINCYNINDVDDILQDTYVELYKKLKKSTISIENVESYIVGIAKNVIKRNFNKNKEKEMPIEEELIFEGELIEETFITKENAKEIWDFILKKDLVTGKIFYLYFILDNKISEISKEMNLNESTVKNKLYRTTKEVKSLFGKEMS